MHNVIGRVVGSILLFALVGSAVPVGAAGVPLQAAHPTEVDWNLSPQQIAANCKTQIGAFDSAVKRIMALKGKRTFANTMLPLENAEADLNDRTIAEQFLFNMATEKAVRDASEQCNIDQSNYFSSFGARPDVYRALAAVRQSGTARTVADKKLLDMYLISFRRSGAALSAANRKAFVDLSNQLTALGSKFSENLNNDATTLNITAAQAASLPATFVSALTKNADGSYTVKVNESTVTPFLNNERDAAARKAYYMAYNNRAPDNVAVLEQAIAVRDRLAHLLGFPSWAAYQLADRMAQTPQRVFSFEKTLDAKLLPQARRDLAGLAALKAQDTGDAHASIEPWDVSYYNNQLVKTKYAVDNEAIRQYFPVNTVIDRIMNLYHKILGVTFVKVQHPNSWNAQDVISTMCSIRRAGGLSARRTSTSSRARASLGTLRTGRCCRRGDWRMGRTGRRSRRFLATGRGLRRVRRRCFRTMMW